MSVLKEWDELVAEKEKLRDDVLNDWSWPIDAHRKTDELILEKLGSEFPDSVVLDAFRTGLTILGATFSLLAVTSVLACGLPKTAQDTTLVVVMSSFAIVFWLSLAANIVQTEKNIVRARIALQSAREIAADAVLDIKMEEL